MSKSCNLRPSSFDDADDLDLRARLSQADMTGDFSAFQKPSHDNDPLPGIVINTDKVWRFIRGSLYILAALAFFVFILWYQAQPSQSDRIEQKLDIVLTAIARTPSAR